jgi:hypothetical protein
MDEYHFRKNEEGLTEEEAKTTAKNYCEGFKTETVVFKVVGKFSPKTTTTAEWSV